MARYPNIEWELYLDMVSKYGLERVTHALLVQYNQRVVDYFLTTYFPKED